MNRVNGSPSHNILHFGVLYDSLEDLVRIITRPARRALVRGDAVYMIVDPYVASRVRIELGSPSGTLRMRDPTSLLPRDARTFLSQIRQWGELGSAALVINQYSTFDVDEEIRTVIENDLNRFLAVQPTTMLCACARDAGSEVLATLHRTHPYLVQEDVPLANREYCPPSYGALVTGRRADRDDPTLRATFRGTGDLVGLRREIERVAKGAGLRGENARAAVLAVHEAAVLLCPPGRAADTGAVAGTGPGAGPGAGGGPGAGTGGGAGPSGADRLLEVRTSSSSMTSKVSAPKRESVGSIRSDDSLQHIRWWCDEATILESDDRWTIQVTTDLERARAGR